MKTEKQCVNCKITGVPLYMGLDGNLHCADHIGLILLDQQSETADTSETKEESHGI
ncbi:MAG: hypothetical protein ACI4JN_06490 [Ruminococcus sp.]